METAPPLARRRPLRRFDSPEQETYLTLWRAYDRLRALEDEVFAAWELTAQQYNLLRLLRAEQPRAVPTLTLATRLVSRAPDITRMLDKLAARGLVERQRTESDRRAVLVTITAAGLELLRQLREPLRRCHLRQLGHMAPDELHELTRLLRKAGQPHEPEDSPWR